MFVWVGLLFLPSLITRKVDEHNDFCVQPLDYIGSGDLRCSLAMICGLLFTRLTTSLLVL